MAVGDMRAEGSMEGGSLGMDDVSGGVGDKACGGWFAFTAFLFSSVQKELFLDSVSYTGR